MYSDMSSSHVVVVSSGFFVYRKTMLTKVCVKCGIEKTIDCFLKKKSGKFGVRADCKMCFAEYSKNYYNTNRDVKREQFKQYYENNREKILDYAKNYYANNREIITDYRESKKEYIASRLRLWKQNNSHKVNTSNAHRRASKLQATPSWADQEAIDGLYQLATIFNRTGMNLHIDHIVPLNSDKVCGLHCESNLQLLSSHDNMSKGNRHWPDQW
jgi:transcription elongation factor Elf1